MAVKNEEKAKVGYQAAINLWTAEVSLSWTKFTAMLIANSIVIAFIGLLLSNVESKLHLLSIVMTIFGLVLCLLWIFITIWGNKWTKYWILSARELEEKYLKDSVVIVSRGGNFSDGQEIKLSKGNGEENLKVGKLLRWVKARIAVYVIIGLFVLAYLSLLIYYLFSLRCSP